MNVSEWGIVIKIKEALYFGFIPSLSLGRYFGFFAQPAAKIYGPKVAKFLVG